MKQRFQFQRGSAILAVFLLLAAVLHAAAAWYGNARMEATYRETDELWARLRTLQRESNYTPEYELYAAKTPLEEIDFTGLQSLYRQYPRRDTESAEQEIRDRLCRFTLPCAVSYYESPGDRQAALVLPAGTEVYGLLAVRPLCGYGFCGIPSWQRGWHYAAPFLRTANAEADDFVRLMTQELARGKKYYVRTDLQLEAARAAYRQCAAADETLLLALHREIYLTPEMPSVLAEDEGQTESGTPILYPGMHAFLRRVGAWARLDRTGGAGPGTFLSDAGSFAHAAVYQGDFQFEIGHVQLCPDFYAPVFDGWTVGLLTASAACLAAHIALRARAKKRLRNGGGHAE